MKPRRVRIVVDLESDATLLELVSKLKVGEMFAGLTVTVAGIAVTEPKPCYHEPQMVEDDRQ